MKKVKKGVYRHYKGGKYEVIGVARHSETLERFVVYRHLDSEGDEALWIRPREMFLEEVSVNDEKVPRFRYLK